MRHPKLYSLLDITSAMDIRSFGTTSLKSTDIMSSTDNENESSKSDTECLEPSPAGITFQFNSA